MTGEIVVRRCTDSDLDLLGKNEPPNSAIARSFLQHQAIGNIVYAAVWRDQQLMGTVVLDLTSEYRPELKHLFVQEAARGDGAGTALCIWTENYAAEAGFNKLYLGVGVDNHGARRLYERLGFKPVGQATTTTYQYVDESGWSGPRVGVRCLCEFRIR
ncbi:GNAT superfamily N-acetyltransferase [Arthrobacter sp. CAN_A2]|uniref:GNAT family N-acetyltransferase n=1 Tax=Arthrobacter sp. CAN_A2 TaxID=2787718 RepID=UPI0018EF88B2